MIIREASGDSPVQVGIRFGRAHVQMCEIREFSHGFPGIRIRVLTNSSVNVRELSLGLSGLVLFATTAV